MKYPSEINFRVVDDGIRVEYTKQKIKYKYNLDVWAICYLLNQALYKENNGHNNIHIPADRNTTALRLYFLKQTNLFRRISWEIQYNNGTEQGLKEILGGIEKGRHITYDRMLSPRGTKAHPESLLERWLSEDLSRLSECDFDNSMCIRQFPANIFEGEISSKSRVTDKFWIDILAINKQQQLSVIELKSETNTPLDIFSQGLDYAVYCHLFKSHLKCRFENHSSEISGNLQANKIAVYLVAENFHPALIGSNKVIGINSLITKNALFDFIFVKIKVGNHKLIEKPDIIFDTRKL